MTENAELRADDNDKIVDSSRKISLPDCLEAPLMSFDTKFSSSRVHLICMFIVFIRILSSSA